MALVPLKTFGGADPPQQLDGRWLRDLVVIKGVPHLRYADAAAGGGCASATATAASAACAARRRRQACE
jgi:hypothetical protein